MADGLENPATANKLSALTREDVEAIDATGRLKDLLVRYGADPGHQFVGMTRQDWKRELGSQRAA